MPVLGGFRASRAAILALGTLGGAALIAGDFLTLYRVQVVTASCSDLASPNLRDACSTTGGAHHGYALLVLGVIALLMTWGAAAGGSRPAAAALLVLGAAALTIALAVDLPDVHKTGLVGIEFASAKANPGSGLWVELAGGGLLMAASALALATPARAPRRR